MDLKEKETLQQASDATVQEPVTIEVDVKPVHFLHRKLQQWGILPTKRVFTLHPITLGSLIKISKLLLDIDMSVYDLKDLMGSNYQSIAQHGELLAKIVAIAIQNNKQQVSEKLLQFILQNFTSREMLGVVSIVIRQMDLSNFMSSIISVKGMNILESKTAAATAANEAVVSPLMQGRSIAPGVQSEE